MYSHDSIGVLFDGTLDGLFNIVYKHYYEKLCPLEIELEGFYQPQIGFEYIYVATDYNNASKVAKSIQKNVSLDAYCNVYRSFLYSDKENHTIVNKYLDIYNYVIVGFKLGSSIVNYKTLSCVYNVEKMSNAVGMEVHLLSGFTRFSQTNTDIYYAEISPKHNVVSILAQHFAERFCDQPWIIHDTERHVAAIWNLKSYEIVKTPKDVNIQYSSNEKDYRELWIQFYKSIAIKERENKKLQRNMLPMYFRKYMLEFNN